MQANQHTYERAITVLTPIIVSEIRIEFNIKVINSAEQQPIITQEIAERAKEKSIRTNVKDFRAEWEEETVKIAGGWIVLWVFHKEHSETGYYFII